MANDKSAEELLTESWILVSSACDDLLEGTERLAIFGLIDEEHRNPLREIKDKARAGYDRCNDYCDQKP